MIENALSDIAKYHNGQVDKLGVPYVLHLLAVQSEVSHETIATQCVALLHDIVEDTDCGLGYIRFRYGDTISSAVDAITKRSGESYNSYLQRVSSNPTAKIVKAADVRHNMSRLHLLDQETQIRLRTKYTHALTALDQTAKEV